MKIISNLGALLILFIMVACEKPDASGETIDISTPDWTEATHGISNTPSYLTVFQQDKVNRLDITLGSTAWDSIQSDLAANIKGGPGPAGDGAFDPVWVPCEIGFCGKQWYRVGIRVKGNSSLRTTYQSGIKKFSFKLDFDQFEDTYPAITNQRFYGFKQLNLNNNFDDKSLMREKIAGGLFREFGVPAAQSAFYELYVDTGSGPAYFGLYTVVEEIDDTGTKALFGSSDGNLYKPEGTAAGFSAGSYNTSAFYKKNNEGAADWTDIKALYDALHSPLRTWDDNAWHTLLESKIDMDLFLKWLAANTVMQNWDTYGRMTHNYYLYNDPARSKFVWIPWDNNEALQTGKMGGAIAINLSGVGTNWPFISFIASDPIYFARYKELAKEFASAVFETSKMTSTYENMANLIREYAAKEKSPYTFLPTTSSFDNAVIQLKQHVSQRYEAAMKL